MTLRATGDLGEGRGFEVEEFTAEEKKDLKRKYVQSERTQNLIKLNPGKWVLPDGYLTHAHSWYNFKFRPEDTVIMSSPKSGTMWLQEILWTMKLNPNLDNPLAKQSILDRSPHLEDSIHAKRGTGPSITEKRYRTYSKESLDNNTKDSLICQFVNALKNPRIFATHLPFLFYQSDLLDRCKVVYIARNPYDVMISYYHFFKVMTLFQFAGDLDQFIDHFIQGKVVFTPYWSHVKQAWQKRMHPNFHWVFYEELKKNAEAEIRKLDRFLQTNLTDQQIHNVVMQSSFESMTRADSNGERVPMLKDAMLQGTVGGFFRKGKAGGWKTALTAEQKKKISEWINENTKDSDLKLKYE